VLFRGLLRGDHRHVAEGGPGLRRDHRHVRRACLLHVLLLLQGRSSSSSSVAGSEAWRGDIRPLVDDLMGMDGWLHDALGEVLLDPLRYWHDALAVDDRLDFINYVGNNILLKEGRSLNNTSQRRGWGFHDMLLDVMHDVLVDLAMDNRLYFNHSIIADCLLNDRSSYNSVLLEDRSSNVLLEEGSLLEGCLLEDGSLLWEGSARKATSRLECCGGRGGLLLLDEGGLSSGSEGLVVGLHVDA